MEHLSPIGCTSSFYDKELSRQSSARNAKHFGSLETILLDLLQATPSAVFGKLRPRARKTKLRWSCLRLMQPRRHDSFLTRPGKLSSAGIATDATCFLLQGRRPMRMGMGGMGIPSFGILPADVSCLCLWLLALAALA